MLALGTFQSNNQPLYFNNKTIVSVPRMNYLGKVEVLRDGQYIPMWNEPEILDLDTLTFRFLKSETGRIY